MVCYKVRWKDLAVVECDEKTCRKSKVKFPGVMEVVRLFKKHNNLDLIRDGDFLKGGFLDGRAAGKRIDVLPDGTKLNKGFPLFARGLKVHDEKTHGHWDVIFQNASGSFTYVYSLEKVKNSKDKKFELVEEFEKCLPKLRRNLMRALGTPLDSLGHQTGQGDLVLAMLILLETRLRVGSEVYYKRSRHKGLTTLKKKNFSVCGNNICIDFVGKDGVPQKMDVKIKGRVLSELNRVLNMRQNNDFVFLNSRGRVFRDSDFEAGFERFCGVRFYPHIVRSHFATREVEAFLRKADGGKGLAAGEARAFCLKLADELGHKKFSKRQGEWEDSFEVTLHYYVRPDLAERLQGRLGAKHKG